MGARGGRHRTASHVHVGPAIRSVLFVVLVLSAGCGDGGDDGVTLVNNGPKPVVNDVSAATPVDADVAPASRRTPATTPVAEHGATVLGVVTRAGQAAVGAQVSLVADDHSERVTTADASGTYRFSEVAAGHYELMVYAESGATCDPNSCISASWAERGELRVAPGQTSRLDVNGD